MKALTPQKHIEQALEDLREILEELSEPLGIEHRIWDDDVYSSVYYSRLKGRIALIGTKEEGDRRKRGTYMVYEEDPHLLHSLEVFLKYVRAYKYLQKAYRALDFSEYEGGEW